MLKVETLPCSRLSGAPHVTTHLVPERAVRQDACFLPSVTRTAKLREAARPVVFRILPNRLRAKASSEGRSGN